MMERNRQHHENRLRTMNSTSFEQDVKSAEAWIEASGIELVYPASDKDKLDSIWDRWQRMSDDDKLKSD